MKVWNKIEMMGKYEIFFFCQLFLRKILISLEGLIKNILLSAIMRL